MAETFVETYWIQVPALSVVKEKLVQASYRDIKHESLTPVRGSKTGGI